MIQSLLTPNALPNAVDECSPPVASLPELVEDLNQSGNLSFFLRAMRREFKWLL